MNAQDDRAPLRKPQVSRFMFAMFDVLGFSRWLDSVGLQAVLDAYYLLIERVWLTTIRTFRQWSLGR